MKKLARRGMVLVLALTVMASPLMAVSAEANNGRGRGPRWGNRGNGGWQREGQNRGSPGYNGGYRNDDGGYRSNPGYNGGYRGDGGSYRSNPGYNGGYRDYGGRNYSGSRNYPRYGGRRYYGHHDSGIVPFIGGLAFGTIIGSQIGHRDHYYYCPPPPPPVRVIHRVYVYHDDTCNTDFTDYGDWCNHLVTYHRVPSCEVRDLYPQYDGGYWEEY